MARATGRAPEPLSAASMRSRGTQACTIAEIGEAEHERPPHLPGHQEGVLQRVEDHLHTPSGI